MKPYPRLRIVTFVVFVLCAVGLAALAAAAERDFACVLDDGTQVPVYLDKTLNNVAVARGGGAQGLRIVVNPNALALFKPATRLFWMAHECAHQQLGHTLGNFSPDRENEADCYAIRQLVKDGQVNAAGLQDIQSDISKIGGDGRVYLSGPKRADLIFTCALTLPTQ